MNTQQTVEQQTVKQQTVEQETTTTGTSEVEENNLENVVVASLVDFGLSKNFVQEWATIKDSSYLQQKLDYAQFLAETVPQKIKSPKGWLVKAIEQDYAAPDGFIAQADLEAEARQYEIEQQRQEELAKLEAAKQQKKAQLEEENYQQWREDLTQAYGTTEADFELWKRAFVCLKNAFISNEAIFKGFIANAEILNVQDDKVLLGVSSEFAVQKLSHRNNIIFEREFTFLLDKPIKMEFVVVGVPDPVSVDPEVGGNNNFK